MVLTAQKSNPIQNITRPKDFTGQSPQHPRPHPSAPPLTPLVQPTTITIMRKSSPMRIKGKPKTQTQNHTKSKMNSIFTKRKNRTSSKTPISIISILITLEKSLICKNTLHTLTSNSWDPNLKRRFKRRHPKSQQSGNPLSTSIPYAKTHSSPSHHKDAFKRNPRREVAWNQALVETPLLYHEKGVFSWSDETPLGQMKKKWRTLPESCHRCSSGYALVAPSSRHRFAITVVRSLPLLKTQIILGPNVGSSTVERKTETSSI